MSAAGIASMRGATRSRSALAAFSTNCRGVNSLIPYPVAAAVPSSSGPFLYGNQRGQLLHTSQFVKANGMRVDTLALVRRMEAQGVPLKHAEAIMSVISEVLNGKGGLQKDKMIRDANLSKLHSQEYLSSPSHMELEKVRGHIEETRNTIKFDIESIKRFQKKLHWCYLGMSDVGLAGSRARFVLDKASNDSVLLFGRHFVQHFVQHRERGGSHHMGM